MRRTATIHAHVERTICAPWGLHGGKDAMANRISIQRANGEVEKFPTGKIKPTEIDAGDSFLIETAGGGGFWNSFERDPERVLADVRAGYVSLDAARQDYGVVIQHRGRRFDFDAAATTEMRRQKRTLQIPDSKLQIGG
jgi:N-methylhydantoinase B